jgi:hypothetical protein
MRGASLAAAIVPAACLFSSSAQAAPLVTTEPALFPKFHRSITDFVVRCPDRTLAIDAPGQNVRQVPIAPGQSVRVTLRHDHRVTQHFVRCLPDDFPTWAFRHDGEQPERWYFMTVGAGFETLPRPFIVVFDRHGVPMWWYRSPTGSATDARLLGGNIGYAESHPGGFGADERVVYRIREPDGRLLRSIRAIGSPTDFHELQPIGNDFLVLTYRRRDGVDLSAYGGPADGTVLDSEIQRIDPRGQLVWSWSSKDHIGLEETGRWWPSVLEQPPRVADGTTAYDLTHINAVELAGDDDLIVSLRQTDAVYRIRMSDGRVRWKLGGTRTKRSLRVLGDPFDYPLGGQHDARLWNGTVTVHDNGSSLNRPPRAVRYAIDTDRRTATLVETVLDPSVPSSRCCGSARKLPNGNWVVGWGGTSVSSVLTPGGSLISRLTLTEDELFSYRTVSYPERMLPRAELRAGMDALYAAGDAD